MHATFLMNIEVPIEIHLLMKIEFPIETHLLLKMEVPIETHFNKVFMLLQRQCVDHALHFRHTPRG